MALGSEYELSVIESAQRHLIIKNKQQYLENIMHIMTHSWRFRKYCKHCTRQLEPRSFVPQNRIHLSSRQHKKAPNNQNVLFRNRNLLMRDGGGHTQVGRTVARNPSSLRLSSVKFPHRRRQAHTLTLHRTKSIGRQTLSLQGRIQWHSTVPEEL